MDHIQPKQICTMQLFWACTKLETEEVLTLLVTSSETSFEVQSPYPSRNLNIPSNYLTSLRQLMCSSNHRLSALQLLLVTSLPTAYSMLELGDRHSLPLRRHFVYLRLVLAGAQR